MYHVRLCGRHVLLTWHQLVISCQANYFLFFFFFLELPGQLPVHSTGWHSAMRASGPAVTPRLTASASWASAHRIEQTCWLGSWQWNLPTGGHDLCICSHRNEWACVLWVFVLYYVILNLKKLINFFYFR